MTKMQGADSDLQAVAPASLLLNDSLRSSESPNRGSVASAPLGCPAQAKGARAPPPPDTTALEGGAGCTRPQAAAPAPLMVWPCELADARRGSLTQTLPGPLHMAPLLLCFAGNLLVKGAYPMFKLPGLPPLPRCSLGTEMAMKAQLTILASTGPPTNLSGKSASTRCARLSHSMNDPLESFLMMMMTVACDVSESVSVIWPCGLERWSEEAIAPCRTKNPSVPRVSQYRSRKPSPCHCLSCHCEKWPRFRKSANMCATRTVIVISPAHRPDGGWRNSEHHATTSVERRNDFRPTCKPS